jgi:hypothetical protein
LDRSGRENAIGRGDLRIASRTGDLSIAYLHRRAIRRSPFLEAERIPPFLEAEGIPPFLEAEGIPPFLEAEGIPPFLEAEGIPPFLEAERIPPLLEAERIPPLRRRVFRHYLRPWGLIVKVFACGEFCFYRIVPNVADDILEMFLIANQAVEIIFLPNAAGTADSLLDLIG